MSWKPWMLTWWHYRRGKSSKYCEIRVYHSDERTSGKVTWQWNIHRLKIGLMKMVICDVLFISAASKTITPQVPVCRWQISVLYPSSFFQYPFLTPWFVMYRTLASKDFTSLCHGNLGVFGSPNSWLLLAMDVWLGLEQFEPPWSQFCLCQEAALPPTLEKEGGRHGFLRVPRESQVPLCSVFVVSPSGLQRKRPRLQGFFWEELLECAQWVVFQHGRLVGS